jgi:hypothetical protein
MYVPGSFLVLEFLKDQNRGFLCLLPIVLHFKGVQGQFNECLTLAYVAPVKWFPGATELGLTFGDPIEPLQRKIFRDTLIFQ